MNAATQAYLFDLGNPYAKLSIADQGETPSVDSSDRSQTMDDATSAYLFKLGNPYAKLSFLPDDDNISDGVEALLWKSKTQIYQFVADVLVSDSLQTRPPPTLRQFAATVLQLSPRGQRRLQQRIFAYLPEIPVARNRLSKRDEERALQRLVAMVADTRAMDAKKD